MIKVEIKKEQGFYKSIFVTGHAMYEDIGKDIVCSAVSSIVITTVNGILSLENDTITYTKNEKGLYLEVLKESKLTNTLLDNMISLLKELEKKYRRNIQIK